MSELLRAKCKLYAELLKAYDKIEYGEVIADHDLRLMDALVRDKDIQGYLSKKLSEV